jgi:hypothetical protein
MGKALSMRAGAELAGQIVDSGAAQRKLENFVALCGDTSELAAAKEKAFQ